MIVEPLIYKIAELLIIMLAGALLIKTGLIKHGDSKVLSRLSLYLVTPLTIYRAFCQKLTPQIGRGLLAAVCLAIAFHILFFLIGKLFGILCHASEIERASVNFTNCGNLIVPIVSFIFGDEWVIYVSGYLMVFNVLFWTLGVRYFDRRPVSYKTLLNPSILAIIAGFVSMLTGIMPSGPLAVAVEDIAAMIGPLTMLIIGLVLGEMTLAQILDNRRVFLVLLVRMVIASGAAVLLMLLSGIAHRIPNGQIIAVISLLSATAPSASNIPQVALLYDHDARYASVINIVTTLSCILFMPLWIYIFERAL